MNRKERRAQGKQGGAKIPPTRLAPQVARLYALADQHHRAGRSGDAELACRQVLSIEPGNSDARHLLGVIALQSGRYDVAAQLLGQAVARNRHNAAYHANLGIAHRMLDRRGEAAESFRRALALDPDLPVIHYNLANVL